MINPKKSLGQNFLIDQNVVKKILSFVKVENNNIIEIGPGTGSLTNKIIKNNPKSLILIEKDFNLFKKIKQKYRDEKNLSIINDDILKFDLEEKIKNNSTIIGNLPYNISSQILIKLISFNHWPPKYKRLILMFQKEVADKLIAKFNTSKYGRLTIISNYRLKVINHFNVSKNCFFPKPKVESTVLIFEPIKNTKYNFKNIKNLELITHEFFSKRRKMINKVFKKLFLDYEKVAKKLNINLNVRPIKLNEDKFYKIVKFYESQKFI